MTVMLSGPPRRLARSTRKRHASAGGSTLATAADFLVGHLPAQPVAAQQEDVAACMGCGPSTSTWTSGSGPETAMDDVAGDVLHLVGVDVLQPRVLPHQAVVVAELLDEAAANAVAAAVADVADPGALGPKQQSPVAVVPMPSNSRFCWPQAWMLALASTKARRRASCAGPCMGVLVVDVRDDVGGLLARLLADGVRPMPSATRNRWPRCRHSLRRWRAEWRSCPGCGCAGRPRRSGRHARSGRNVSPEITQSIYRSAQGENGREKSRLTGAGNRSGPEKFVRSRGSAERPRSSTLSCSLSMLQRRRALA